MLSRDLSQRLCSPMCAAVRNSQQRPSQQEIQNCQSPQLSRSLRLLKYALSCIIHTPILA